MQDLTSSGPMGPTGTSMDPSPVTQFDDTGVDPLTPPVRLLGGTTGIDTPRTPSSTRRVTTRCQTHQVTGKDVVRGNVLIIQQ
jgi:hypothetical protein